MAEQINGKIMLGVGGLYTVRVLAAPEGSSASVGDTVVCRARGSFKHRDITLLAGDNVIISPTTSADKAKKGEESAEFVIDELCERKNALIRPPLANLDYMFITMAAASPAPILTTVDKLICIAEFNNIEPTTDNAYLKSCLPLPTCVAQNATLRLSQKPVKKVIGKTMQSAAICGDTVMKFRSISCSHTT